MDKASRRIFVQTVLGLVWGGVMQAAPKSPEEFAARWEPAADVLRRAVTFGQIRAAVLHVRQRDQSYSLPVGNVLDEHAPFLLGSISKPICMTGLMKLYDQGEFQLTDPLVKYLPKFQGEGRELVTITELLTHRSGLPDQLVDNAQLRRQHAPLSEFVEHAERTPLEFPAGTRYQYSSMGILLLARLAELISGHDIVTWIQDQVFQPLQMAHSAQGLGNLKMADVVPVQTEHAAPESGGGDVEAKNWDWNSPYWRALGAPWGGTHASAGDVGKLLAEYLWQEGQLLRPETARLMIQNHNPPALPARGLAWDVGSKAASPGCSTSSFGHSGSTGTWAWADPASETICVVLTSLPGQAADPHPRELAGAAVAASAR